METQENEKPHLTVWQKLRNVSKVIYLAFISAMLFIAATLAM